MERFTIGPMCVAKDDFKKELEKNGLKEDGWHFCRPSLVSTRTLRDNHLLNANPFTLLGQVLMLAPT